MDSLLYETRGAIAIVTINRPKAMNAYDSETIKAMGRRFEEFDADPSLRVAILTATGDKSFCAGADLKSLHGRSFEGGIRELWDDDRQYRLGQRIQLRKPVIAAVNGYCLAGGLELALACDLRIASRTASFGCPEVRNAILHGYGAMRLVQMIPFAVAMDMLLTGNRLDGQRAYDVGLVSQIVEPDELMPAALKLAETVANNAPLSVKLTKELAWRGLHEHPQEFMRFVSAALALLHASEDAKEGPLAFAEKRAPKYKDR
jgi:enoyl-CoA hydratase/carnithine racemase